MKKIIKSLLYGTSAFFVLGAGVSASHYTTKFCDNHYVCNGETGHGERCVLGYGGPMGTCADLNTCNECINNRKGPNRCASNHFKGMGLGMQQRFCKSCGWKHEQNTWNNYCLGEPSLAPSRGI